jgi:cellulose synthase/poly-beta-1,6-N-acetylglucosamine synthase-like glycosyltransferase
MTIVMRKRPNDWLLVVKIIYFFTLIMTIVAVSAQASSQAGYASPELNLRVAIELGPKRAVLTQNPSVATEFDESVENVGSLSLNMTHRFPPIMVTRPELNIIRLENQNDQMLGFYAMQGNWLIQTGQWLVMVIIFLIILYSIRHYLFTLNRLFSRQRRPYLDIEQAQWPRVTVLIAAHNEESVIAHSLDALLEIDYPLDKLQIMPVNDRSQDRTREIIDFYVNQYPGRFHPFHRNSGKPGKAAALKDAVERVDSEIIIVFDADYVPSEGLLRQLVAPFFDPEVGAVMGRVVPMNVDRNFLTRILDLERSGGYQVDQQARMNLGLVPQYGGTVGGVRRSALEEIGGWNDNMLTEDTDATYRLLMAGWKTVYQNRSECYEEVPEKWAVRIRQIKRWSKGHNQVLLHSFSKLLKNHEINWRERIDGLFLLGVFAMSPILLLGWVLNITLFYAGEGYFFSGWLMVFFVLAYGTLGNSAAFFEIATAACLDGNYRRIRLLPFNLFGFLVSLISISWGCIEQMRDALLKKEIHWDKTERFRRADSMPNDEKSITEKNGQGIG